MQNVMNQNFVYKTDGALVATRMDSDAYQRSGLASDSYLLKDIVLSCEFTNTGNVVPQAHGAVFFACSDQKGPLHCDIHRRNAFGVEALQNEVELDFAVEVLVEAD